MRLSRGGGGRLVVGWSATLLAAGLLSGCGLGESGLQREAARQLQARVLEVTQASSQNDPAAALTALEGLEAELEKAQANGQVSEERRRSITTIATAVRADLEDAIAAQKAAADTAAAEKAAQDTAEAERAAEEERIAAEQAAAEAAQPAPAPAPAPAPEPDEDADKKDQEKGKGKD
ncbi:hypothetical protein [Pseudarthrobacter sp. NS4]|uniref:hypothetical protein n=1 Tax=Pseudarthrobacter sp. NS4 TaxID=2973976 RepID=UPI002161ECC1|nr:hypothetical protein [Pseudarthrobacter sp. NS4]